MRCLIYNIIFFLFIINGYAQSISGKVIDRQGNPIQYTRVVIDKTSIGCITDSLGIFKINTNGHNLSLQVQILNFYAIGYIEQSLPLKNIYTTNIIVVLDAHETLIDEGYWVHHPSYIGVLYKYVYPNLPLGFGFRYTKGYSYKTEISLGKFQDCSAFLFSINKTYMLDKYAKPNSIGILINYQNRKEYRYCLAEIDVDKTISKFQIITGIDYLDLIDEKRDRLFGAKIGFTKGVKVCSIQLTNRYFIDYNIFTARLFNNNLFYILNRRLGLSVEYNHIFNNDEFSFSVIYEFRQEN